MASKPIRVFYSPLSRKFYASSRYKQVSPTVVKVTGEKWDVTADVEMCISIRDRDIQIDAECTEQPRKEQDNGNI